MPAPDRHHFRHPFYLLICVFTLFTIICGWELVKGHLDQQTPRRFSPWMFHEAERKAAMMALGAACAGGLIVLRAWFVFAFPAKEILCIVLLVLDLILLYIGMTLGNEFGTLLPARGASYWLVAAFALLALVLHHLLYIGLYFLAYERWDPRASAPPSSDAGPD